MRRFLAGFLCLAAACGGGSGIRLTSSGSFEAEGGGVLVVTLEGSDVPLFGETRTEAGRVLFAPRYPLSPGKTYVAVHRVDGRTVRRAFTVPAPPAAPPVTVSAVEPSGDLLPENLLKFYIHFSAPMARGDVYDHIRLLRGDGTEVERPFLQLAEELWDGEMTRLTIFFDPGRIKRGLRPREEVGPALEEGKAYALVVGAGLSGAAGEPLEGDHVKRFTVGPPDDTQPDPRRWRLRPPSSGTRDPLVVEFDEPLDAAMLRRVVGVVDGHGERPKGAVEVAGGETVWRFRPARPWRAGAYVVETDAALEDRSGNSIGRPFEVDLFRRVRREVERKALRIPFAVR